MMMGNGSDVLFEGGPENVKIVLDIYDILEQLAIDRNKFEAWIEAESYSANQS